MSTAERPMIAVRGLTKQFRATESRVTALKDVTVDVEEGELFVIVGASGSGKTTLLRCVAGLETADSGKIRIGDQVVFSDNPPTWVSPQERRLGMVFQSYAVWPHLTVYQNVALPLTEGSQRVPRSEVDQRVREALRMMQIEEVAHRSATLLSGGQQQRVALARAVAVNPRVLLMDEPLSNLDARLREEVRGAIRQLAKQLGATVLYVTHDQVEAMAMADKIAMMASGRLLQVGTPTEMYLRPRRPQVAEFFGTMNWLQGSVIEPGVVETPVGPLRVQHTPARGERVLVGFRPESLVPAGDVEANSPNPQSNTLEARLDGRTFLGDQLTFFAQVRDQRFLGKARWLPADASRVELRVDPVNIMVFLDRDTTDATGSRRDAELVTGESVGAPSETLPTAAPVAVS